jgi:hypothetical protein
MGGFNLEQLYNDTYKVGTLFQENVYQNIFMGESIRDSDLVVVINELKKSEIINQTLIDSLRNTLLHLIHFEENDFHAIFITEFDQGTSVFQMIDNVPNTTQFKMNILHDYLNHLKEFDSLLPVYQFIFASESQFFIKDGDLVHNQLLIIDEEHFDPNIAFGHVKHRIALFGQKIMDYAAEPKDEHVAATLKGFFEDLETDPSLSSLEKIFRAYRKIYIYDMYLDKNNDDAVIVPIIPIVDITDEEDPTDFPKEAAPIPVVAPRATPKSPSQRNSILLFNKDKFAINPLYVVLIIIALSIALFAIFAPMINKITDTKIPVASFEKEKVDDQWKFQNNSQVFGENNKLAEYEWTVYSNNALFDTFDTYNLNLSFVTEGIYTITLRVMDAYGNWSKDYSEEIYYTSISYEPIDDTPSDGDTTSTTEPLNSYGIAFEGTPTFDETTYRNGDRSIKMTFDGDQTHGIVLDDFSINNNTRISFWIKASDDSAITISVMGLNDSKTIFDLDKVIRPDIDQWEQIVFNTNSTYVNTVKILVNGKDMTLWLDDIEINSYK